MTQQPPAPLITALFADPTWSQQLAGEVDSARFARCLAEGAAARGLVAHVAQPVLAMHVPPAGWLPVAVTGATQAEARVTWLHMGEGPLDEPFYDDRVRRMRARPFNRWCRVETPLSALAAFDGAAGPDGILYHQSRCGSTLAAQMLAAVPGHIMVSEAEPFDAVLRLVLAGQADGRLLRAMAAALLRDRDDGSADVRRFLKLDAWHMLAWRRLAALFPATPAAFLYRDPVEILVSHARMPGRHVVPGQVPLGLFGLEVASITHADHGAYVLGAIGVAAADATEAGAVTCLIAHRDLPDAMASRLVPHFGLTLTRAGQAALERAGRRDAKQPSRPFAPDSQGKRLAADDALRDAAARHMLASHARLEALSRR